MLPMWIISHEIQILKFLGDGTGSSLNVTPSISSSLRLVSVGGGRGGILNSAKTWKTTRMNIARPILECLKEKCIIPDFSRTYTPKENYVMVKKQLGMLQ